MSHLNLVGDQKPTDNSKHDVQHNGEVYSLDVQPCPNGVHLLYCVQAEGHDMITGEVVNYKKSIIVREIHLTRWDKLFFPDLENRLHSKVEKVIKEMKLVFKKSKDAEEYQSSVLKFLSDK